jgi:hypothetical protein
MSANKTDVLKSRLIAIAAIFTVSPGLFSLFLAKNRQLSERQKIEATNQALTTSATLFLGFAVMLNAYYAAKRAEAIRRSAIAAEKSNEINIKNTQIAEKRLVTESFMTAITQLGHESVATRTLDCDGNINSFCSRKCYGKKPAIGYGKRTSTGFY